MKAFLLAALLATTSLAARAQIYYLDLSSQALDVPRREVAVEQVLDGRVGNPPIGTVYEGLKGNPAVIAFRGGLGPALTTFVHSQLPARRTDHTVLLCVRSLHISETKGGSRQEATAELTADVYEYLADGYHLVRSVGAHVSAADFGVTYLHAGHVARLLSESLGQLAQVDWKAVARQPARSLAELAAAGTSAALPTSKRGGHPIFHEAPRRGLYYRLEEFLTNQPDTISAFVVDTVRRRYSSPFATRQWLGVARVRPLAAPGKHAAIADDLWGFSDGHQAFVRHRQQYYPLVRQGSFYTFVGEAPEDKMHAAALAQKQLHGGALAGLAGAALAGTNVPNHTAEPMAYGLDLQTGILEPYPGVHTPLRHDTAYVYVYWLPQAAASKTIAVTANDQFMGELHPGQYLEVPWARFGKPMRLCLVGVGVATPCQCLVPNTSQLNYLKINPASTPRPWEWMPPRQGAADLDELDKPTR